jgi:hypothetical protein
MNEREKKGKREREKERKREREKERKISFKQVFIFQIPIKNKRKANLQKTLISDLLSNTGDASNIN